MKRDDRQSGDFEFTALVAIGCIIGAALVFIVKAAARVFA